MAIKVRRYRRKTFSSKKKKLSESLQYLKGIPFYAIAEHKEGNKKEVFIEFLPRSIERIIKKAENADEL